MSGGIVTVMFADLARSTEMIDAIGDAEAQGLHDRVLGFVTDACAAHGGDVVKNLGDGLMVAFPSAVEAVSCAVDVQEHLATEPFGTAGDVAVALRVGLNSGEAIQRDGDYFGAPVVVASRLCDSAHPGQVLVSRVVAQLVGSHVDARFEHLGSLTLKGLADPVAACEVVTDVIDAKGTPARGTTTEIDLRTSLPAPLRSVGRDHFVGRGLELAWLHDRLHAAREGTHQLALIGGEAGVGKSRLAGEFARRAHEAGSNVLLGRCDESGAASYQPFTEAFTGFARDLTDDTLRWLLGRAGPEVGRMIADIGKRLPGHPAAVDGDSDRFRFFESIRAFLATSASAGPTVLLLDDLHLAERSALAVVRHLARATTETPLLVIATYRDNEVGGTPLHDMLTEFRRLEVGHIRTLTGLDGTGLAELVSTWAGGRASTDFVHDLARHTSGNPLFTREMLRHLMSKGELVNGADGLSSIAPLSEVRLPDGVRTVLQSRLATISDQCRAVLDVASVAGDVIEPDFLEGLLPDLAVFDVLDEALSSGVIVEGSGDASYRFAHDIVRRSLYDSLPSARRRDIHATIGHDLATGWDGMHPTRLTEVARHLSETGDPDDLAHALSCFERAGDEAMLGLAFEDAAQLYDRALRPGARSEPERHIELLHKRGRALAAADRILEAREVLAEAGDRARREGMHELAARTALAFHGEGVGATLFSIGGVDEDAASRLRTALRGLGDEHPWLRARLLANLAIATLYEPNSPCLELAAEADRLASAADDDALSSYVLVRTIFASWNADQSPSVRLEAATAARTRCRAAGDRESEFFAEFLLMDAAFEIGDLDTVRAALARCEAMAATVNDPIGRFAPTWIRTTLATATGDFDEAERLVERGKEFVIGFEHRSNAVQPGAGVGVTYATQVGVLRLWQGRVGELASVVDAFADALQPIPALRALAGIAWQHAGEEDKARDRLRRSAREIPQMPRGHTWTAATCALAVLTKLLDDRDTAAVLHQQLSGVEGQYQCTYGGMTAGAMDSYRGMVAALAGHHEDARRLLERGVEQNDSAGLVVPACYARIMLAEVLRTTGEEQRARALVTEARATADRIGAGFLVSLADDVLSPTAGRSAAGEQPDLGSVRERAARRTERVLKQGRQGMVGATQRGLRRLIDGRSNDEIERRFQDPRRLHALFQVMARGYRPERAHGFRGSIAFHLHYATPALADQPTMWCTLEVDGRRARFRPEKAARPATAMHMSVADFVRLAAGDEAPLVSLLSGRVNIEGDIELAGRAADMFGSAVTEFGRAR